MSESYLPEVINADYHIVDPTHWLPAVDPSKFTDPVPSIKRRYLEVGGKGYFYADIDYVKERLNQACGNGGWAWVRDGMLRIPGQTRDGKEKFEFVIEGRIVGNGIIPIGVYGVGSADYLPHNANASYAFTIASATSEAIKNAAKTLGIGLDIADRDAQELAKMQQTLQTLVDQLAVNGKREPVLAAVRAEAPQALDENDRFSAHLVNVEAIDKVKKAILRVAAQK